MVDAVDGSASRFESVLVTDGRPGGGMRGVRRGVKGLAGHVGRTPRHAGLARRTPEAVEREDDADGGDDDDSDARRGDRDDNGRHALRQARRVTWYDTRAGHVHVKTSIHARG